MRWPILASPLPAGKAIVTSGYTSPRTVGESSGIHGALDFAVPRGTPVLAMADGVVKAAGERANTGRYVLLEHTFSGGPRLLSRYIHLDSLAPLQVGQKIRAGQVIGASGSSGGDYSQHLHVDVRVCGQQALVDYRETFGWPATETRPVLVATEGCYVVPAEPLVRVDGYAPRVLLAARTYGIPLASDRSPDDRNKGNGPVVLLVATALMATAAAGVYYLWTERKTGHV